MTELARLRRALPLRLGVGIVFVMWIVDKFVNPAHAERVFAAFCRIPDLGTVGAYCVGALHLVSTASSYERYPDRWNTPHLLFFAAFPMLAACYVLYLMRDEDTLFTFGR